MSREVYMSRYMSFFIENKIAGFKKNRDQKKQPLIWHVNKNDNMK